jgi:hypothetical protein
MLDPMAKKNELHSLKDRFTQHSEFERFYVNSFTKILRSHKIEPPIFMNKININ